MIVCSVESPGEQLLVDTSISEVSRQVAGIECVLPPNLCMLVVKLY